MPTISSGAIFSAQWDGRLNGQQILLTHHYHMEVLTGENPELLAVIVGMMNQFGDLVSGQDIFVSSCYTPAVIQIKKRVQMIYPVRYVPFVEASFVPEGSNTEATITLPPNVSAAVTFRALIAGPHSRGTKHIAGMGDNFVENGFITPGGSLTLQNFATKLKEPINLDIGGGTQILRPIIYNRALPANSEFIESAVVQPTSRVERRRTVGLGT